MLVTIALAAVAELFNEKYIKRDHTEILTGLKIITSRVLNYMEGVKYVIG